MIIKLKKSNNESGISLVEVLASVVILSLLLTSFFMLFIQSSKTSKNAERIIDATYVAQTEMEKIYASSTDNGIKEAFDDLGYTEKAVQENWNVFEKLSVDKKVLIKVRVKMLKEIKNVNNMVSIIVEVYELPNKTQREKMQNVLMWGAK